MPLVGTPVAALPAPADGSVVGKLPAVTVLQFVQTPVLSARTAVSTPLSAAVNDCCQLAVCIPAFVFCEAMKRLVAQIRVRIVTVSNAIIKTLPWSHRFCGVLIVVSC